jgi:hypothetical protein
MENNARIASRGLAVVNRARRLAIRFSQSVSALEIRTTKNIRPIAIDVVRLGGGNIGKMPSQGPSSFWSGFSAIRRLDQTSSLDQ